MDLRKPRPGELIAGVSGAALLLAMFLHWYDGTVVARAGDLTVTVNGWVDAWEAFSAVDVLLALLGCAGIALALIGATQRTPAVPIAAASLLTLLALLVSAVLVVRLLSIPEDGVVGDIARTNASLLPDGVAFEGRDVSRAAGVFVGLAACLGVLAGGLVAMRDEGLGRRAGRWQPGEESPVDVATLPPPQPRT